LAARMPSKKHTGTGAHLGRLGTAYFRGCPPEATSGLVNTLAAYRLEAFPTGAATASPSAGHICDLALPFAATSGERLAGPCSPRRVRMPRHSIGPGTPSNGHTVAHRAPPCTRVLDHALHPSRLGIRNRCRRHQRRVVAARTGVVRGYEPVPVSVRTPLFPSRCLRISQCRDESEHPRLSVSGCRGPLAAHHPGLCWRPG